MGAVSWRVEDAPPVIKKIHKAGKGSKAASVKADPLHGLYEVKIDGKPCVVEYEPDSELRDNEQIPLLEEGGIEAFIRREVLPYTPDAWIVEADTKIGYEVSFTRHFYKPPATPHARRNQRRHPRVGAGDGRTAFRHYERSRGMKKKAAKAKTTVIAHAAAVATSESGFGEVLHLIQSAKQRVYQAVNTELVTLYWQIGEIISRKIVSDGWGKEPSRR